MALSFENTNQNNVYNVQDNSQLSFGTSTAKQKKPSDIKFEGNPISNAAKDINEIGAGITSFVGAIFGYDKEARTALVNLFNDIKDDPREVKQLGDALLSTYNLTVDDFGNMPLGEIVGNAMSGIWEHPVSALMDILPMINYAKGVTKVGKVGKTTKGISEDLTQTLKKASDMEAKAKIAEAITNENILINKVGYEFTQQISNIAKTYSPDVIAKGMQAIETVGFKSAPQELQQVMKDLNRANDTYKQFVNMSGAPLLDDVDFATRELISKQYGITFDDAGRLPKDTKLYQNTAKYVEDNDVRPLFHLKPEINKGLFVDEEIPTGIFKRVYGTMDYSKAAKDLVENSQEFVSKVDRMTTMNSIERINKKIEQFNKDTGREIKKLTSEGSSIIDNRFLRELNSELKKTMLSSGVYLGANILTTTLSILNNFDFNGVIKTFKDLPKFRMVKLDAAKSPVLNLLSRVNNITYRPIVSVDKYLEQIALKYINNIGLEKAKYMQSAIPSRVATNSSILRAVKGLVPFGSYPTAAIQEIGAHIAGKPLKVLGYNQLNKLGQEVNVEAQEQLGLNPVRNKAVRLDENGNQIQRNTVITPIQAANMFLLGTQGDAIQVPIYQFLNKLTSGKGDPSVFEVNGRKYKVKNGKVQTYKGDFDLIPALAYLGRNTLSSVQFYNQVIVPLMTDKYVRDETKLFNQAVTDAKYTNMTKRQQNKVVDNTREKLGKRVLGTYEYKYYDEDKIYSSTKRRVLKKYRQKQKLNRALK